MTFNTGSEKFEEIMDAGMLPGKYWHENNHIS